MRKVFFSPCGCKQTVPSPSLPRKQYLLCCSSCLIPSPLSPPPSPWGEKTLAADFAYLSSSALRSRGLPRRLECGGRRRSHSSVLSPPRLQRNAAAAAHNKGRPTASLQLFKARTENCLSPPPPGEGITHAWGEGESSFLFSGSLEPRRRRLGLGANVTT